jgi:hypothetical protein
MIGEKVSLMANSTVQQMRTNDKTNPILYPVLGQTVGPVAF